MTSRLRDYWPEYPTVLVSSNNKRLAVLPACLRGPRSHLHHTGGARLGNEHEPRPNIWTGVARKLYRGARKKCNFRCGYLSDRYPK